MASEAVLERLTRLHPRLIDLSLDRIERLLAALGAARAAGGDYRGLMSASLLCLTPERPPLDLRIDSSDDPLGDLRRLYDQCNSSPYKDWLDEVPVAEDRHRAPDLAKLESSKAG